MKMKLEEIAEGRRTGYYPPAVHFFKSKEVIENSDVFKFLKKLPKGIKRHFAK